jgi:hypothetical protein
LPFLSNVLEAVGCPDPYGGQSDQADLTHQQDQGGMRQGRQRHRRPFCDEAQRYDDDNEYKWLRDVHDHRDRLQIKLFTFLLGQQDLLTVKIGLQCTDKMQIVARLMVDELTLFGICNANDMATCQLWPAQFQWQMENLTGVESTSPLFAAMKRVLAGQDGGDLRWQSVTRNRFSSNAAHRILPSELFDSECPMPSALIFLKDYRSETLTCGGRRGGKICRHA